MRVSALFARRPLVLVTSEPQRLMPGVVVGLKVKVGNTEKEGESVAMKMETSIPAAQWGEAKRILVNVGAKVEGDNLILEIE